MISYKNENGNVKELAAGGTMGDLLAESAYLLTAVYSMLARRDKAAAEIFKVSMMMAVGDRNRRYGRTLNRTASASCSASNRRRARAVTSDEVLTALRCWRKRQLQRMPEPQQRPDRHELASVERCGKRLI